MTLPRFAVTQCGCMDEEYQCSRKLRFRHYYMWLSLQVLEVHINSIRGIIIHITESKIHISCSENSIIFIFTGHPFATLAHIIAEGTFKRHHYSSQHPEKLWIHNNVRRLRLFLENITCTRVVVLSILILHYNMLY